MKRLTLLLPLAFFLSACSTYVVSDYGNRITETYTNSDGTRVECVTETGYSPGGYAVTPGGVMVFPSYRRALSRECVTNKKQRFNSAAGTSVSMITRQTNLLGLSESALTKLRLLMSQGSPSENARAELQARGIGQKDLSAAITLAIEEKEIPVEEIVNNTTFKVVSEYLGTTPEILFTALRFLSDAIQVDMQIQRGIRLEQNSFRET